ncbi:MAG: hypothetical protein VW268_10980 [Rhodospirillaceae bacterium]
MVINVFAALGVGEVMTANTNEEALNTLKRMAKREIAERLEMIDLVICEHKGMRGLSVPHLCSGQTFL